MITFDFPQYVFIEKELVKISLRFGEETYFMANDRIQIYVPMILDRPRPKYLYTDPAAAIREIFVYGSNYWDTSKQQYLKCRIDNTALINAVYVNSTLVMCNVSSRTTPGTMKIEIGINGQIFSTNSLTVNFVDPPSITTINTTWYF